MLNVKCAHLLQLLSSSAAAAWAPNLQQIAASSRQLAQVAAASSLQQSPHILPKSRTIQPEIPSHDIEDGLPEVQAWLRHDSGTRFCTNLRKGGHTPCVLFSLPGNQSVSLTLSSKDAASLVRNYGRNGLQAQVLKLNIIHDPSSSSSSSSTNDTSSSSNSIVHDPSSSSSSSNSIQDPSSSSSTSSIVHDPSSSSSSSGAGQQQQQQQVTSVRVITKEVHMNSVSLSVENFRFMFAPRDRPVSVDIPVKIWNADISPGVKSGGWLHVVNRTIPTICYGWAIQPDIELDMRSMKIKDVIRFRDVALPKGCQLRVSDPLQPVVRCAARVGGD